MEIKQKKHKSLKSSKHLTSEQLRAEREIDNKKFNDVYKFTWKKLGIFLNIIGYSAKNSPFLFISMIIITFLNGIVSTILPLTAGNMTRLITSEETVNATDTFLGMTMYWHSWIWVFLVLFIVMVILEFFTNYLVNLFAIKVELEQRQKILVSLMNQDVDFFFDHVSGNILTRFVADTQALNLGIHQFLINIVYIIATFITATTILFLNRLTMIGIFGVAYVLGILLVGMILYRLFRRAIVRAYDIKREVDADMTDRINNITLIKASGTELYEIDRLYELNEHYSRKGDEMVKWSSLLNFWLWITVSSLSVFVVIFVVSGALTSSGGEPKNVAADIVIALPLIYGMANPVLLLVPTLRAASRSSNAAERINDLTGPKPTILPNLSGPKIKHIDQITFKNLVFAYPKKKDKIILPKINFTFEKGKSYAFVGETGSGKSTIGRLLLRYYEPIDGKIVINNKEDLHELNLPSYLDRVGYVEQDPQIFYGNFYENIKYGRFNATNEQVEEAAKKADLHNFILTLPDGYNTVLGQRGFLLSGGQKQRLVIARLFLKNPDLIILDEATSALDNIVEKEIQKELDKLVVGKTSITIAHRLSTIKNVDQIIVLGTGKGIVQTGTFNELINKPGLFKDLYEAGKTKD